MSKTNDFGRELLDKIKSKQLAPKPRWRFLLKNYSVWTLGVISLLIGSLAFSIIVYMLRYNDWDIYSRIDTGFWSFVFLALPYFWLVLLGIFIFVVYYNVKHTKNGYRYPLPILLLASIFASVFLGSLFYALGFGHKIDDVLGRNIPMYEKIINPRMRLWVQPERGRLSGRVISKISEAEIIVLTYRNIQWRALIGEAKGANNCEIIVGRPIRMLGEKIDANVFKAFEIFPVGPGRGFLMRDYRTLSPVLPKPPFSGSEDYPNNF